MPDRRANRLSHSTSPYLLQHAFNPVDWWPWCDEAFAEAQKRDVPVLVSIGYSTCYWCHVMERESFESPVVARPMNEHFVCIKVDREERPDVDDLYMAAAISMNGHAGWPLNVFLEPAHRRPFWCGTYFPPDDQARPGMPGLPRILGAISAAWRDQRDDVLDQSQALADAVRDQLADAPEPTALGESLISGAVEGLLRTFDRAGGGFGHAPKFPQPSNLDFLLDARAFADEETRAAIDAALLATLDAMMIGGLHDQAGGGFHRYCVDANWTVPHFEKMLYDNALLASLYARAAGIFGDPQYARTASRTLDYILREMTSPEGAFFSAQDAEVDGREGLNYLWTSTSIRAAIPDAAEADWVIPLYGVDKGPNFKDPHHPDAEPASVLRLAAHPQQLAANVGMDVDVFTARIDRVNTLLLAARSVRKQPRRDDKILASWNGLMIAALADAARLLNQEQFLIAARRAAHFALASLTDESGKLARSWRAGVRGGHGFLEDSACLALGLLSLARAETDPDRQREWTAHTSRLLDRAQEQFADSARGGWFDAPANAHDLFVRPSSSHDGAMPSGQSVMLHALLELDEIQNAPRARGRAIGGLGALSAHIARSPLGSINSVRALLRILTGPHAAEARNRLGAAPSPVPGPTPGQAPSPRAGALQPVAVFADVERITLATDTPAQLRLAVRIEPGYHMPAADPGTAHLHLTPFRIGFHNGSGLHVFADYPPGTPSSSDPTLLEYRSEFEVLVAVEKTGPIRGNPLLTVTFQPCSDTECLPPSTVELDVAIDAD